ncbi:hypothetical protein F2Q65_15145 [Thiohalocapsa marina]|uniref:Fe2OG dioxygenase domain-containing protein n=1 Tax=Thiohalocapsa marina TaxID=424902 RepID=A0A5M8FFJ7_9GAMM|nr:putative 2OG-Fe(II) oxygenase [Thiohalocapsa marina]KAA6183658.1 hypothetical protein F2Q65_15145 [Thiohalocapsa marina]
MQRIRPIDAVRHPDADDLNARLAGAFQRLQDADFTRRSHFIDGRFENLYLDAQQLDGAPDLIDFVLQHAATALDTTPAALRCGFWLNAMHPGQRTSRHTHDENDEQLSAVYYVTAPPNAGDILFHDHPFQTRVTPTPGLLLLFPPDLLHSVEENHSPDLRLSIAFNLGPSTAGSNHNRRVEQAGRVEQAKRFHQQPQPEGGTSR